MSADDWDYGPTNEGYPTKEMAYKAARMFTETTGRYRGGGNATPVKITDNKGKTYWVLEIYYCD